MPMPPPNPSIEGHRDGHIAHEIGQLTRALAFAVTDGVVHRSADGTVATPQASRA